MQTLYWGIVSWEWQVDGIDKEVGYGQMLCYVLVCVLLYSDIVYMCACRVCITKHAGKQFLQMQGSDRPVPGMKKPPARHHP